MFRNFLADERGATAIEYGLLAALISLAIVVGARAIGVNITTTMYAAVGDNLN